MSKFGTNSCRYNDDSDTMSTLFKIVKEIKKIMIDPKPGYHSVQITFKTDEKGNTVLIDEVKVSSFGDTKPNS